MHEGLFQIGPTPMEERLIYCYYNRTGDFFLYPGFRNRKGRKLDGENEMGGIACVCIRGRVLLDL